MHIWLGGTSYIFSFNQNKTIVVIVLCFPRGPRPQGYIFSPRIKKKKKNAQFCLHNIVKVIEGMPYVQF